MPYPLPDDTVEALDSHRHTCRNVGLLLDKFAECDGTNWTVTLETKRRKDVPKGFTQPELAQLLCGCRLRHEAVRRCYRAKGYTVIDLRGQPDYRLVVGFGAEHVLETNLCLHRIYGFPIIPGSAVKGVTRAWKFWELAEQLNMQEDHLSQLERLLTEGTEQTQRETWRKLHPNRDFAEWQAMSCDFYEVFGTTEQQGQVVFFDAYPSDSQKLGLELDIVNPHYGDYYQKKDRQGNPIPPADYLTPKPTYFLTVAEGSPFQFAVASKDSDLTAKAKGWLTCALTDLGIGGKTAVGYGVFQRIEDPT